MEEEAKLDIRLFTQYVKQVVHFFGHNVSLFALQVTPEPFLG
jgi:hypothetical protein